MTLKRIAVLLIFGCLLFAGFKCVRADAEEGSIFPESGTLSGEYVLKQDEILNKTLVVEKGSKASIDLNGFTLTLEGGNRTLRVEGECTLKDGKGGGILSGKGVRVNGKFLMEGGSIEGNFVEEGSVFVDTNGSFTMTGGRIASNSAEEAGGGVMVRGEMTLGGNAEISDNLGKGKSNNLFLSEGKELTVLKNFEGNVGVTLENPQNGGKTISSSAISSSGFFSDDPLYTIVEEGGLLLQKLSPLREISVSFEEEGEIYPLTDPKSLKDRILVSFLNENGVPYPEDCVLDLSYSVIERGIDEGGVPFERESDFFSLGENEVRVQATGIGGEKVSSSFTLQTVVPELERIEVSFLQKGTIYFDADVSDLYDIMNFSVKGIYEDGISRDLFRTAEETKNHCGTDYILEYYKIEIDLSSHPNGQAEGKVQVFCGEELLKEESFFAQVSKKPIDLSKLTLKTCHILEGEASLDVQKFVPSLPQGVLIEAFFMGIPLDAHILKSGVYSIELRFSCDEREHYELMGEPRQGKLVIYEKSRSAVSNGIDYAIEREGGISPEWEFTFLDVTKECNAQLSDEYKLEQAISCSFFPGESEEKAGSVQISVLLTGKLKDEEFKLFRVRADGSLEEVSFERKDERVIFSANDLLETQYLFAVESNNTLYVILAICFGAFCLIGAALLVWYFVSKKNLELRKTKKS